MLNYTKAKIEPLIQRHNRTLTLDDVDVIVELDKIASRIQADAKSIDHVRSSYFSVGDKIFSQQTFARASLCERILAAYGDGYLSDVGLVYALDMERTREEIEGMPSRTTLLMYRSKLHVTLKEVSAVFADKLGGEGSDSDDVDATTPKEVWQMCAFLAKHVGGTPDEWMHATQEKIEGAATFLDETIRAEQAAAGSKQVAKAPTPTPLIYAVKEFSDKLKELEASWVA